MRSKNDRITKIKIRPITKEKKENKRFIKVIFFVFGNIKINYYMKNIA